MKLAVLALCVLVAGVGAWIRLSGTRSRASAVALVVLGGLIGGALLYYVGAVALTFVNGA